MDQQALQTTEEVLSALKGEIANMRTANESFALQLNIITAALSGGAILLWWALRGVIDGWRDKHDSTNKTIDKIADIVALHEKDVAVLKSNSDVASAIRDGLDGVATSISDRNARLDLILERRRRE